MPIIEYKLQGDSKSLVGATDAAGASMTSATAVAGALVAGVTALGAAYVGLVEDIVEVTDQVNTLSKATGFSNETINALRLRAEATGKSLDQLVPKRLAKNMLAAQQGSKAMAEAFADLGVDVEDKVTGELREVDEVLPELIDKLGGMENQTLAAGLAAKVGGTQMTEMLSAFDDSESFENFVRLGNEFGVKTGPEAVAAASEWQGATAALSLAFEDAGAQLIEVFGGTGAAASIIQNFSAGFVLVTSLIGELVDMTVSNIKAAAQAAAAAMRGDFAGVGEALGKIVDPVTGWIDAIDVATERARMFKREQLQGISEVVDAQEEETEGVIDGEKEKQKAIKDTAKARKDAADEALQALEDERQFLRDMAQLEKDMAAEVTAARIAELERERSFKQSVADFSRRMDEKAEELRIQREEAAMIAQDSFFSASAAGFDFLLQQQLETDAAATDSSKKAQEERRRAIRRTFAASQAAAVASIAIDAAAAIIAMLPAFSFLTVGAPLAATAVVAPLAAIQTAQVLSQSPPVLHDGTANVDEVLAVLKDEEAVLNQRGAESIGRERIERANRGEPLGGSMVSQIVFRGRVLDQMMSQTIQAGGSTQRLISAGRAPAGTLDPFGGT